MYEEYRELNDAWYRKLTGSDVPVSLKDVNFDTAGAADLLKVIEKMGS